MRILSYTLSKNGRSKNLICFNSKIFNSKHIYSLLLSFLLGLIVFTSPQTVFGSDDPYLETEPTESPSYSGSDAQADKNSSIPTQVTETTADQSSNQNPPPRGQRGKISITTTPSKAVVYLAGQNLGKTPIEEMEVNSGRHDLTIMLEGEELVRERVNIWPNQTLVLDKKLILPYGSLTITTTPSKAKVFIDGENVGQTSGAPLTVNNIQAGTRILKVTAGKKSKEMQVEIKGEETLSLEIVLGK